MSCASSALVRFFATLLSVLLLAGLGLSQQPEKKSNQRGLSPVWQSMTTHFKILQQRTRRWLSVEGLWEARLAGVMEAHGLTDLRIYADGRGSKGHLDFLRDLPFLERLSIIIVGLRDVSPLYDLPNLRTFEFRQDRLLAIAEA
jgi:hypothetical protein